MMSLLMRDTPTRTHLAIWHTQLLYGSGIFANATLGDHATRLRSLSTHPDITVFHSHIVCCGTHPQGTLQAQLLSRLRSDLRSLDISCSTLTGLTAYVEQSTPGNKDSVTAVTSGITWAGHHCRADGFGPLGLEPLQLNAIAPALFP